MEDQILGIHHITAIAGPAQRNYDFYTKVLGLRLVKKTVNFDDPETYHFYYGNQNGTPGTILTFFPWTYVKRGTNGTGVATEIGYAVPKGSLEFWLDHLIANDVKIGEQGERFGEKFLSFQDPDGLLISLVEPATEDARVPWTTDTIKAEHATRGFHHITLNVKDLAPTAEILTDIFGYTLTQESGNFHRFQTQAVPVAGIVDIEATPLGKPGHVAGGTNHHVAFRVKDEATLMRYREKIVAKGFHITEKIDRNYFYSLYFREPGGILFEIATDNPGFTVDEPLESLGEHLKLPAQYEEHRGMLEKRLPPLTY